MKKHKKILAIIIVVIIALTSMILYFYKWEYREPLLEVNFFSLNRGRSIFIRTPLNKTILVGGGQNSEAIREITKNMPFYRRKIDYVVIPSATPAQIGGLIEIIDRYEVGKIITSKFMATSTVLTQLMGNIRKKKIHVKEVERGDQIEIEDNFTLDVLFPYKDFKFNKTSLPELGLALIYKNTGVYLMGNLSKTIQKDILKNLELKTDRNIVEYYHSMTDTKTSSELLEKIDPEYIFSTKEKTLHLVSDGEGWKEIK